MVLNKKVRVGKNPKINNRTAYDYLDPQSTLVGNGHADLDFGNCWPQFGGSVKVMLDGVIIASAGPKECSNKISFDYFKVPNKRTPYVY